MVLENVLRFVTDFTETFLWAGKRGSVRTASKLIDFSADTSLEMKVLGHILWTLHTAELYFQEEQRRLWSEYGFNGVLNIGRRAGDGAHGTLHVTSETESIRKQVELQREKNTMYRLR